MKRLTGGLCILYLGLSAVPAGAQVVPTTAIKPPTAMYPAKIPPAGYSQSVPVNFVRSWAARKPVTNPMDVVSDNDNNEVLQTTQYIDGMGRMLQTVVRGGSPAGKDMVQPVLYDAFGREAYRYLPYISESGDGSFKTDPFNEQATFYSLQHSEEQFYYSHTQFEGSPLSRIAKSFAPGNTMEGSEVTTAVNRTGSEKGYSMQYLINDINDPVQIWTIDYDPVGDNTNIPVSVQNQVYAPGTLFKTVTLDENNTATVEYKDIQGNLLLKKVQIGSVPADFSGYANFLCTYYVYDDFGRLRTMITPKAVAAILNNWSLSPQITNELCFRYEYDTKNRLIAERKPGSGWVYTVYDRQNSPVYIQDANLRLQNNRWLGTRYDLFERPVETGMLAGFSGTRDDLQLLVESAATTQTTVQIQGDRVADFSGTITISNREAGRTSYQATNSIVFQGGFTTEDQAMITAQIVTPSNPSSFTDIQTFDNDIVPAGATLIPLTLTYYDNYDWSPTSKTYSTLNNAKLDNVGTNLFPEALPAQESKQVRNLETGHRVKVIEDPTDLTKGKWLETVSFYNDKERVIQTQNDNYKGGIDILTSHYNFSGALLNTYEVHNNPAANVSNLRINTLMVYDQGGRLTSVKKTLNDDLPKQRIIAQYAYDELGNVINRKTGNKTSAGLPNQSLALENDDYYYNLQGKLKGINWDQITVLPGASGPSSGPIIDIKTDKWFAMNLNYDWGFSSNQYNGNISGIRWSTAGDQEERSYGYSYDQANRFRNADFRQRFSTSWLNQDPGADFIIDFSVKNVKYDENGNLTMMQQYALQSNHSSLLDDLAYTCFSNTNKLKTVTDNVPAVPGNGFGDFMPRSNASEQYGYDANGNLTTDLNKRFNGTTGTDAGGGIVPSGGNILYNFLDQPYLVRSADDFNAVTTISYLYDATGNKLEKTSTAPDGTTTITDLIGDFVYTNNLLQYFGQEQGRIRVKRDVNGLFKDYMYDYFLTDHLGSVRTVLTDEVPDRQTYLATMEDASRGFEVSLFGNKIGTTVYPKPCGFDDGQCPVPATSANQKVARVNGSTAAGRVGPGLVMKIMAGDKFSASTFGWYNSNQMNTASDPALGNIVADLLTELTPQVNVLGKGSVAGIAPSNLFQPGMQSFSGTQTASGGAPLAYLNYILFDEKSFKAVQTGFSALPKMNPGDTKQILQLNSSGNDILLTHNGYLYVWVSNESKGDVYFDDIRIDYQQGPLLEENQYYPFGLQMATLSSHAYGSLLNKFRYQGDASDWDEETGYNEFDLRNYDPQIGRWTGVDPYGQFPSPYTGIGNDPVNNTDRNGGDLSGGDYGALIGAAVGFALPYAVQGIGQIFDKSYHVQDKGWWGALGAFAGAGVGYGIGQTYFDRDGMWQSYTVWDNMRSFYAGFFGRNKGDVLKTGYWGYEVPVADVWGWTQGLFGWDEGTKTVPNDQIVFDSRLGPLAVGGGYLNFPNYQSPTIVLPTTTDRYIFSVDGQLAGDYSVTPPGGAIPPGTISFIVNIILNPAQLIKDEMEFNRQINQYRGDNGSMFQDNHDRNYRDLRQQNDNLHLRVRKVRTKEKHYWYPVIFGIKLKFLKFWEK